MSNIQKAFKNKAKRGLCMASGGFLGSARDALPTSMSTGATSYGGGPGSDVNRNPAQPVQAAPALGQPTQPAAAPIPSAMRDMASLGGESPLAGEGHGAQHNWLTQSASDLQAGNPRYRAGSDMDPHASGGFSMPAQAPARPTGYAGYTAPSAIPTLAPLPTMAGEARRGLRMADGGVVGILANRGKVIDDAVNTATGGAPAPVAPPPAPSAGSQADSYAAQAEALERQSAAAAAAKLLPQKPKGLMSRLGFASGGVIMPVEGEGGPREDKVPVVLAGRNVNVSDGEKVAVIPAKTAQNPEAMDAITDIMEATNDGRTPRRGLSGGGQYSEGLSVPVVPKVVERPAALFQTPPQSGVVDPQAGLSFPDRGRLQEMQLQSDLARVRQAPAQSGEEVLKGFNRATAPQQTVTSPSVAPTMAAEERALQSGGKVADIQAARRMNTGGPAAVDTDPHAQRIAAARQTAAAAAAPAAPAGPSPLAPEMTIPAEAPAQPTQAPARSLKGMVNRATEWVKNTTGYGEQAPAGAAPAPTVSTLAPKVQAQLSANMADNSGIARVARGFESVGNTAKNVARASGPMLEAAGTVGAGLALASPVIENSLDNNRIKVDKSGNTGFWDRAGMSLKEGAMNTVDAAGKVADTVALPFSAGMNYVNGMMGGDPNYFNKNHHSDSIRRGLAGNGVSAPLSPEVASVRAAEDASKRPPVAVAPATPAAAAQTPEQAAATEQAAIAAHGEELQSRSIRSGQLMDTAQQGMRFPGGKDAANAVKRGNVGLRSLANNATVRGDFNASHQEQGDNIAAHVTTTPDGRTQTMLTGGAPTKAQYLGVDGKPTNDWYSTPQYAESQRVNAANDHALKTISGYNTEAMLKSNNPLDREKGGLMAAQRAQQDATAAAERQNATANRGIDKGFESQMRGHEVSLANKNSAIQLEMIQAQAERNKALIESQFGPAHDKDGNPNPIRQKVDNQLAATMAKFGVRHPGQLTDDMLQHFFATKKMSDRSESGSLVRGLGRLVGKESVDNASPYDTVEGMKWNPSLAGGGGWELNGRPFDTFSTTLSGGGMGLFGAAQGGAERRIMADAKKKQLARETK